MDRKNKIKINSKSAEFPRSTWEEVGMAHARGKKAHPCAKEKFALASASTVVQKGPFYMQPLEANTWMIKFSRPTPCLLLASLHYRNWQYKNTNFGLINHRRRLVFLTPCLRDTTISFGFRKNFFAYRIVVGPRNQIKIQRVSWSLFFLPSGIHLQPFTDTEEASESIGVRRKSLQSDIEAQKPTLINQPNKTK